MHKKVQLKCLPSICIIGKSLALVVQWITRKIPVLEMGVRFPPRASKGKPTQTLEGVWVGFFIYIHSDNGLL